MNFVRKAVSALASIVVAALLISVLAPKATHGIVAAWVQVLPSATTHMGQSQTQLVSLWCYRPNNYCWAIDPTGSLVSNVGAAYVVPQGYTLIVTDWEWSSFSGQAGALIGSALYNNSTLELTFADSSAVADMFGNAFGHEHFTGGVRVGAGVTLADLAAAENRGAARVQGYLVPNN